MTTDFQLLFSYVSKFISDIRPPAHYTNTIYKHKYINVHYMHVHLSIYIYYKYNIFIIMYICTDILNITVFFLQKHSIYTKTVVL